MSAAIWCKEHIPTRTVVHRMHDPVNQNDAKQDLNALQLYAQNFKQADLTLTGTVRKANLANIVTKSAPVVSTNSAHRRQSTTTIPNGSSAQRASSIENHADSSSPPQSGDRVCITCGIDVSPKWWSIDKDQEKIIANGHYGSLGSEAQKFMAQRSFQCHKCKKAGRKPALHAPSLPVETLPPVAVEQSRAPPPTTALTSPPPHVSHAVNRISELGNPWGPRAPVVQAPPAQAGPPPVTVTPLHAPSGGPPPPLPLNPPSHTGPSPMAAPGHPAPVPPHHYSSPSPYGDWHRTTQHQTPVQQMNGGPPGPSPIHHNALRDLRPPPITPLGHHQAPPPQHGLGQPMVNGMPASPPRRGLPSVQNGSSSYLASYHHPTHHPLHNLTNGAPPARTSDHSFPQGLLGQRPPFSTPHAPTPLSRDGYFITREPSVNNTNTPPTRPNDARPPSGASASPSLRNLLL